MSERRYWGIDGCKGGWVAIGLGKDGSYEVAFVPDIATFWQNYGQRTQIALIDIPIGLSSKPEGRQTESTAREFLQGRRSSVFNVPTREAIMYGGEHGFDSETYKIACDINREIEGKAFSKQSWFISAKIHEVDALLRQNKKLKHALLESHPEVLFWALNRQQPMLYSKKTGLGFMQRVKLIEQYQPDAYDIVHTTYERYRDELVDDDVVDALVCAVSGRLGNLRTLPDRPQIDTYGLPMQMIYPKV